MTTTNVYYNQEVKDMFLAMYPEESRRYYKRIFSKSEPMENDLNKDIYDFTLIEIEKFLYTLNPLTVNASQTNFSIVSSYINFCIDKGLRSNVTNQLRTVGINWCKQFVDTTKKLYYSETKLREIECSCVNAQDAVILRLLFNGVSGHEFIELRNLKKSDIDYYHNAITLTDENYKRKLWKVDDRCMNLIDKAYKEDKYIKRNGMMEEHNNVRHYTDLVSNDYIIRKSKISMGVKNSDENTPVEKNVIFRRLRQLKDLLNLPYLTSKNIERSGIIYEASKLLERDGVLEKPQYEEICTKHNINDWLSVKEYCNVEVIKSLYK